MEPTKKIYPALAKFQGLVQKIDLDGTVTIKPRDKPAFTFSYATLAHIIDKIKPAMKEAGLGYTQCVEEGKLITTVFAAEDGSCITSTFALPVSADPKQVGGNMTYFRRYSLTSMLGIAAEEDKDAPEPTQGKPALTPKALESAVTRIKEEPELLDKMLIGFVMTADQVRQICQAEKAEPNG